MKNGLYEMFMCCFKSAMDISLLVNGCLMFAMSYKLWGWVENVEIYAFGALSSKNVNFDVVTYAASNRPR